MKYTANDHTWVLCAYGESPYLEECILSLKNQKVRSRIIITTSTPSEYISELAQKYKIPVFVNEGVKGIGGDWNYAYSMAETALITIAHQDDIYDECYTEHMIERMNASRDPILFFCDYYELRNGTKVHDNTNLKIKRILLLPLRVKALQNSRFVRRRVLSFGCSICCPSVTYVHQKTGDNIFSTTMKVSLDWDQWEKQSKKRGAFVYDTTPLMCHRVHENSATTKLIEDSSRSREDLEMFRRFWPDPIARILAKKYSASEKSNQI